LSGKKFLNPILRGGSPEKFWCPKNFFGHFWEKIWKNGKNMAPW
jgi:hypothetical protein